MTKLMKKLKIILFLMVFMNAAVVFAETTTLVCGFPEYSDNEGRHQLEEKLVLTFLIDWENRVSYMVVNSDKTEVQPVPAEKGMSFIEITSVGNIMTTTIDGNHNAVHSRHAVASGVLVPTQYYGSCEFE